MKLKTLKDIVFWNVTTPEELQEVAREWVEHILNTKTIRDADLLEQKGAIDWIKLFFNLEETKIHLGIWRRV